MWSLTPTCCAARSFNCYCAKFELDKQTIGIAYFIEFDRCFEPELAELRDGKLTLPLDAFAARLETTIA